MGANLWNKELEKAQTIALKAGRLALSLQSNLSVTHKPLGHGPVSNGDLAADHLITEELKNSFPKDYIVSEESYASDVVNNKGRVWFVDPIDGTSSYILGRPDFVTMIGLAYEGTPVVGAIYQPSTDILWSGINSSHIKYSCAQKYQQGVKNAIPIRKPGILDVNNIFSLIASRTSKSQKQFALIKHLNPESISYYSSVGLKSMLVLDGIADLYVCWSHHVKMWDSCAPVAIMKAAGTFFTGIDGLDLNYQGSLSHGRALIASNFAPSKELLALLKLIDDQKLVS